MNKKSLYSILSVVVAMIVLSVTLVLAIGPKVSADIDEVEIGVLDKAEYFHFADDEQTIIDGLTVDGNDYANEYRFGGLLRVVIPNGVTEIRGMQTVNYGEQAVFSDYAIKDDSEWYEDDGSGYTWFHADKIIEVALPESLTTIGDYAFYGCSRLTEIVIPANVTEIGVNVFDDCYDLKKIVLENDDLFDHPNLQPYVDKLRINGVGVLDKSEYFMIDENGVLCGLSAEGHYYANRYDELHVVIPEGVVEIYGVTLNYRGDIWSRSAFTNRDYTDFMYYSDVVDYGKRVTSIVLPDTLETINDCAFAGCQISDIYIPQSVESINMKLVDDMHGRRTYSVFEGCDNLTTVYCACSKEYANEHWNENWNKIYADSYYDEEQNEWVNNYKTINVVWNCNKTITFDVDGGNETIDNQIVCVDGLVTAPEVPTKDGYIFNGWLLNGEPYDFATPVTEDMTLTANWGTEQTQPELNAPETPAEENAEVNNQNNAGLIWGIAGTSAGVLIIAGVTVGIVIAKRRRK